MLAANTSFHIFPQFHNKQFEATQTSAAGIWVDDFEGEHFPFNRYATDTSINHLSALWVTDTKGRSINVARAVTVTLAKRWACGNPQNKFAVPQRTNPLVTTKARFYLRPK
jgi:hypothetical protein